jgi:hypothetical protein
MLCEKCKSFVWVPEKHGPFYDGHHPDCPDYQESAIILMNAPSFYGGKSTQVPLVDPNGKLIVDYKKPKGE